MLGADKSDHHQFTPGFSVWPYIIISFSNQMDIKHLAQQKQRSTIFQNLENIFHDGTETVSSRSRVGSMNSSRTCKVGTECTFPHMAMKRSNTLRCCLCILGQHMLLSRGGALGSACRSSGLEKSPWQLDSSAAVCTIGFWLPLLSSGGE